MQHIHFDEAEIIAQSRKLAENIRDAESAPGSVGVQARMMAQVMEHWHVAFAREMNRGTSVDDMLHAVPAVISNMLLGVVESAGGTVVDHAGMLNFMMMGLAQTLQARLAGDRDGNLGKVDPKPHGHA
jgi:hypothetical protein